MADKQKIYSKEFRDSAIQMVLNSGKSASQVARELGLPEWKVGAWIRASRKSDNSSSGNTDANAEHEELQKLRREYKRLQEENEILKKAAAFFAQHQR
jgi:transposase